MQYSFCCIAPRFRLSKSNRMTSIQRGMTMFSTLRNRYNRWQRYNRTVTELESLSNRDLADLGISRVDIPRLAREAVRS